MCNDGQIENEEHFLLHCKKFQSKRLTLLSKIKCNIMYDNFNFYKILKLMLNNSSVFSLKLISSYIIDCLKIRSNVMS